MLRAAEPSWTIEQVAFDHPDAVELVAGVQAEYVDRYGGTDDTPVASEEFVPPQGAFFVGRLDGTAVASGAWRRSDVEALGSTMTAEIKRMYVVPGARRRGLSRLMLAHLEQGAAAAGVEVIVLESGLPQPEALGLYESSGYVPIPAFGHYRGSPLSRCFAKRVGAAMEATR